MMSVIVVSATDFLFSIKESRLSLENDSFLSRVRMLFRMSGGAWPSPDFTLANSTLSFSISAWSLLLSFSRRDLDLTSSSSSCLVASRSSLSLSVSSRSPTSSSSPKLNPFPSFSSFVTCLLKALMPANSFLLIYINIYLTVNINMNDHHCLCLLMHHL